MLNHRKRIKLDHSDIRDGVELPLLLLIRLARLFNRKRKDVPDPVQKIRIDGDIYTLSLEKDWIHDHPLAAAQIAREQVRWSDIGVTLALDEE